MSRARALSAVAATLVALTAGCAHAPQSGGAHPPAAAQQAPAPDSVTLALWHLDENGGTRAADAGPFGLDGTAGVETHTDFGRFRGARVFSRALDSFIYVPYNPTLETHGGFTIEAWVNPLDYGDYEDTPIAARWTPQGNQRSWLLSIVGRRLTPPTIALASPGIHDDLVRLGTYGALMFAFQADQATPAQAFFSTRSIALNRWTHVAATFDGDVVRLYLDGMLDSQYATQGRIRPSDAPLVIGNSLDPRWLTDFGGDLRTARALDTNPYYAFLGSIDEVRLSNAARTEFSSATGR